MRHRQLNLRVVVRVAVDRADPDGTFAMFGVHVAGRDIDLGETVNVTDRLGQIDR